MKENRKTETCEMKVIARIHTDFPEKFGIQRSSEFPGRADWSENWKEKLFLNRNTEIHRL